MHEPMSAPGPDWGVGHYERTAQGLLPAARVLVEAAQVRAGERVLDLGSGTGNAALLAAAAGADVTAVDPSPRLLSVAAAAAQEQGLPLDCQVGDAASVPAAAGHFDCVLSNFGLIFASDPDAAVAEVGRVLGDRGRVLFTAWRPGGALGALAARCRELVLEALRAPAPDPGFPWHDVTAVDQLLGRHELAVSEVRRDELVFAAPSPAAFLEAEIGSHPLAVAAFAVLERTGQAARARERLLRLLTEHNEDEGRFRSTSRYVVLQATAR